jgi:hypothetical protein
LGDAVMRDGLSDLCSSHSLVHKDAAVGHPMSILVGSISCQFHGLRL